MIKKFFYLSTLCLCLSASAQKAHVVEKGDNPYNISKKYGITLDQLYKLNPEAKGTLALGQVLTIAIPSSGSATKSSASNSQTVGKIILEPKQTIYGITKQYHISEADLRNLNPNLDSNMKIGDAVAIPANLITKYAGGQKTISADSTVKENTSTVAAVTKASENTYTVESKDNYYRISRKFKMTQKELFDMNPGLEQKGLQAGDVLNVSSPYNFETKTETKVEQPDTSIFNVEPAKEAKVNGDFLTYTVQNGDTVFGILNKFGVSLDELISLNPQLSEGLKAGMVLKIKKLDAAYVKESGDALNVVFMLPFGFDTNDSRYRTLSLDFLTGAKLAIERNVKSGQKLNIKVIDAGNEKSFKNSLTQINVNNTDLIIGPFFKSNVIDVLDLVKEKNIPVVAPFANSEELHNYGNLIIIESNNNVFADRIVKEVKDIFSDQKIFIVADADKVQANYIKAGLAKALKTPNVIIVNSSAEIVVENNMMTGQSAPVIAILATDDENEGERFAAKIIDISKETAGNKAFSMFYNGAFEKNTDELSQASFVYLMDRKIDMDGTFEKEIMADYKTKYCKTPSKYSVIGFDVVNDMLSRENAKGEIFKQINKVQTQLATKFEFVRTKANGAYQNTGYRVVRMRP